jgi:hypothetical protein
MAAALLRAQQDCWGAVIQEGDISELQVSLRIGPEAEGKAHHNISVGAQLKELRHRESLRTAEVAEVQGS